jgi:hypothetical protein
MGIINIDLLKDPFDDRGDMIHKVKLTLQEKLVAQHRAGLHPVGEMRRECPLCQAQN